VFPKVFYVNMLHCRVFCC